MLPGVVPDHQSAAFARHRSNSLSTPPPGSAYLPHNTLQYDLSLRRLMGHLDRPKAGFHECVNFALTAF
jgi:hypothetical protein